MITEYSVKEDGIWLTFDKPFAPNGGITSNQWFFSWEKLGTLISRGSR